MDKQPCDCIEFVDGYAIQRCECRNSGDLATAQDWCTRYNVKRELATAQSTRIEALTGEVERLRDETAVQEMCRRQLQSELEDARKTEEQVEQRAADLEKALRESQKRDGKRIDEMHTQLSIALAMLKMGDAKPAQIILQKELDKHEALNGGGK